MTAIRLPLFSLALFFLVQTTAQQTAPPAPARDPVAVALLAKSFVVMTGGQPISDVTLHGTARRIAGSDDETGTVVLKALATGEARIDFSFPSGPRTEVCTASANTRAGQWLGPDGIAHPISYHNLMTESSWFFPALMLARVSFSQSYILSYPGQESPDGRLVQHLSISLNPVDSSSQSATLLQHLSQTEIYLDSSTLLPIAITFNVHPDNDAGLDIPVEVRFSDYRPVNGAQGPFRVQKFLNNGLVLDLQFQTVALNAGLSPSAFSLE